MENPLAFCKWVFPMDLRVQFQKCGLKKAAGFIFMQPNGYLYLTSNHLVAYNGYMNENKDAIFKALADSTRRLILDELSERNELTLYELTARLIMKHNLNISRQAIAKHLSVLDDAGLVKSKRKGKYRVLIFSNEPLKNLLEGWIE